MEKTIEIPEGYEAQIKGNKVILEPKESEDERIYNLICSSIKFEEPIASPINRERALAYLERQKEQKPAEDKDAVEETPKQDYSGLTDLERAIHRGFLCAGVKNVPVGIIKDTAQDCLAQIKPAEWSEEDEIKLASLINYFEGDALDCSTEDMVRWLKSLRPHWKPSEEQMEALFAASERNDKLGAILNNLYNDLKKL